MCPLQRWGLSPGRGCRAGWRGWQSWQHASPSPGEAVGRAEGIGGWGQVTWSNGIGAGSARAAHGPGEAAPAPAQALHMGAAFRVARTGVPGAALRLAWHPVRSKESVQVWEKVSGLQDWFVTQQLCPCCWEQAVQKAQNLAGGGRTEPGAEKAGVGRDTGAALAISTHGRISTPSNTSKLGSRSLGRPRT